MDPRDRPERPVEVVREPVPQRMARPLGDEPQQEVDLVERAALARAGFREGGGERVHAPREGGATLAGGRARGGFLGGGLGWSEAHGGRKLDRAARVGEGATPRGPPRRHMIRIAIFNENLCTFGGGERACFALASTLSRAGYEVDVLTREAAPPTPAEVADFFGPGHDGFRIVSLPGAGARELEDALRPYTVFVNHSAGSCLRNPCPLGIYFVMFPFQLRGAWLDSYHHFVCNSLYTARHTRFRWGADRSIRVVYPAAEDSAPATPTEKAPEIVAIGRFNAHGHRKNQAFMAGAFAKLAPRLPDGWRLSLVGKVNVTGATLEELLRVQELCAGLPVDLVLDAADADKRAILARASVLWHATGALAGPDQPDQMEHFGIAVVEGMSAGAVPVCFDGGGLPEIVDHGDSGYLFHDMDGLVAATARLAEDDALRARMSAAARARAARYGRARFDAEVTGLFRGVVA